MNFDQKMDFDFNFNVNFNIFQWISCIIVYRPTVDFVDVNIEPDRSENAKSYFSDCSVNSAIELTLCLVAFACRQTCPSLAELVTNFFCD